MKIFNSIQLVVLFAISPFIIQWVHNADFYAHVVIQWILIVGYVFGFGGMVYAVYENFDS